MFYQYLDENDSHCRTCKLRHDVNYTCLHYEKIGLSVQCLIKKNIPDCIQLYEMELGGNLTFSVVKRYQLRERLYDTYRCNRHPHHC